MSRYFDPPSDLLELGVLLDVESKYESLAIFECVLCFVL